MQFSFWLMRLMQPLWICGFESGAVLRTMRVMRFCCPCGRIAKQMNYLYDLCSYMTAKITKNCSAVL